MISKTLKTDVGFCGTKLGFEAKNVSSHSLRTAGVMALLCSVVDSDIIKLIGSWYSNEILRYLRVQSDTLMRNLLQLMLTHVKYSFLPHQYYVPCF